MHGFILLVNSKHKNGDQFTGNEETRCQPRKREGTDLGDALEDGSSHNTQPMGNWGKDFCARDNWLRVLPLGMPAHQTSDCARLSLKPHFPLHRVSPSPFFEFGLVSVFLTEASLQCCPPPAVPLTRLCAIS